jgi:hypothetical protein
MAVWFIFFWVIKSRVQNRYKLVYLERLGHVMENPANCTAPNVTFTSTAASALNLLSMMNIEKIAEQLERVGYVILDQPLLPTISALLLARCQEGDHQPFNAGQIGRGVAKRQDNAQHRLLNIQRRGCFLCS